MASDLTRYSRMEASAVNEMAHIVAEAKLSEVVALAIETRIYDAKHGDTEGCFASIPTKESLDKLFTSLRLRETA